MSTTLRRKHGAGAREEEGQEITCRPVPWDHHVVARKRPRNHTLEASVTLRPLLGVSMAAIVIPHRASRPGTLFWEEREPQRHRAATVDEEDDEKEEGEWQDENKHEESDAEEAAKEEDEDDEDDEFVFTRMIGENCHVERVGAVITLDQANGFVRPHVILPSVSTEYLPLGPDCYVYTYIQRAHPHVTVVVMCVAASLMRRVLCTVSPVSLWMRVDKFESLRPVTSVDTTDVMRYIACIMIANKVYGSLDDPFQPRHAIQDLVHRSLAIDEVAAIEREILCMLEFRIGKL